MGADTRNNPPTLIQNEHEGKKGSRNPILVTNWMILNYTMKKKINGYCEAS